MAVVRTQSEIVFACHSAACRPPTSGGTGGSNPGKSGGGGSSAKSGGGGGSTARAAGDGRPSRGPLKHINPNHSVVKTKSGYQVKNQDGKVIARGKTQAAAAASYKRAGQKERDKMREDLDVAKARKSGNTDAQGPAGSFHPTQKGNTPVGQWGARFQGGQQAAGEALTKNGAIGTVAKARGGYRATYKSFGSKETKATFPTREDARKWVEASVNNVTGKHGGASSRPPSPRNFGGKAG